MRFCFLLFILIPWAPLASECKDFLDLPWTVSEFNSVVTRALHHETGVMEKARWKTKLIRGPWTSREDLVAANRLRSGQHFPEIGIVVHQLHPLQIETAKLLNSPRFKDIPVITLASDILFVLESRTLIERAQLIEASGGGEFLADINTSKVHLFGGRCQACMSYTAKQVIKKVFSRKQNSEITLVYHLDLSYFYINGTRPIPTQSDIRFPGHSTGADFQKSLAVLLDFKNFYISKFTSGAPIEIPKDFSIYPFSIREPFHLSRLDPSEPSATFTRGDRKIHVEFK